MAFLSEPPHKHLQLLPEYLKNEFVKSTKTGLGCTCSLRPKTFHNPYSVRNFWPWFQIIIAKRCPPLSDLNRHTRPLVNQVRVYARREGRSDSLILCVSHSGLTLCRYYSLFSNKDVEARAVYAACLAHHPAARVAAGVRPILKLVLRLNVMHLPEGRYAGGWLPIFKRCANVYNILCFRQLKVAA